MKDKHECQFDFINDSTLSCPSCRSFPIIVMVTQRKKILKELQNLGKLIPGGKAWNEAATD